MTGRLTAVPTTLVILSALAGISPPAHAQAAVVDHVLATQGGYATSQVSVSGPTATDLVAWPTTRPWGWSRLDEQVLVTVQDAAERVQTPGSEPDKRTPQLIVGSGITLVLLLILLVWLQYRPERDRT